MHESILRHVQEVLLAQKNHRRVKRILAEIDKPRNQAIAEARLDARHFIDNLPITDYRGARR
jgi:hypothetical protein